MSAVPGLGAAPATILTVGAAAALLGGARAVRARWHGRRRAVRLRGQHPGRGRLIRWGPLESVDWWRRRWRWAPAGSEAEHAALLESVARTLRSGSSLLTALEQAAGSGAGRVVADLDAALVGVRNGGSLVAVLEAWGAGDDPARTMTGVALTLGAELGGARARALDDSAAALRDRAAVAGEVRALTAQARASATVMVLAPVGFAGFTWFAGAGVAAVFATPLGLACVIGGLALDAVGGVVDGGVDEAGGVMVPHLLPVLVAGAVLAVASPRPCPPARLSRLTESASAPRFRPGRQLWRGATWAPVLGAVGGAACRVVGAEAEPAQAVRVGLAVVAAALAVVVHPLLAGPAAAVAWAAPVWVDRSRRRRRAAAVVDEAPDLVELFRLAVGAGLTVHLAVAAVAPRAGGVTGHALAQVPARVAMGEPLADSLAAVAECGDGVRPLVAALVASERYGVALGPSLERVALEARLARRRRAEEAARQLPVLLLFPLVVCILPAFVLLTVVPLLVGSLPRLSS